VRLPLRLPFALATVAQLVLRVTTIKNRKILEKVAL
jgi:hypothetical protein